MSSRFSFRLLGAVGIIIVAALIAVGLMSGHLAETEVHRLLTEEDVRRADAAARRMAPQLSGFFRQHGSWDGVDSLLTSLAAAEGDLETLLLNPDDQVVAASDPHLAGIRSERRSDGALHLWTQGTGPEHDTRLELLINDGLTVADGAGALVVLPHADSITRPRGSLSTLRARVMLAVAAAGVVALIATWLLSRRFLGPIDELIVAARHWERGNLDHRVARRSSDEIGRLAAAFNAMAEGLARLEELRRRMVSDVAHELRTPLTGIRCQIETLQDGLLEPTAGVLASLHDDVMGLQHLVEELQELAVAEAGGLRLEPIPLSVSTAVEGALTALANGVERAPVTLSLADVPPVAADPARLRQILSNLLDNAFRHTPADGTVEVVARQIRDRVQISIQDSGPGIEPEHLPKVFERFYRADASRQRGTGGFGLGLAIVKQLVEAHGGRIWADSEPGCGTCFSFTLPCAAESAAARNLP